MITNFEQLPSIKVCCCGGRACPTIKIKGKDVIIIDDAGNQCWLTEEQILLVSDKYKELKESLK